MQVALPKFNSFLTKIKNKEGEKMEKEENILGTEKIGKLMI